MSVTTRTLEAPDKTSETEAPRRSSRRSGGNFPPARGIAPLVVLLALWQILGTSGSPYYPRPSAWWSALSQLWNHGQLASAIGQTVEAFVLSLIIATVVGSVIGLLTGALRPADRSLSPTLEFMRAIPAAAVVPVFNLILGYHLSMTLSVVVFAAVWPVLLSTRAAVREMNPLLADVGRTLHLSRKAMIAKVYLPSMMPAVLVGVRVAAPLTLIITLLVEILTGVSGLGALISVAQRNFESAQVYGLVAVAGVLALIVNLVVVGLEARLNRYKSTAQ